MRIDGQDFPRGVPGLAPAAKKPETPEEAARQFEQVLVKQMLHTMTKDLFGNSLAGDDAPQWMSAYSDIQSDILTEELAKQFTKSGKLGIAELLLKQWKRQEAAGAASDAPGTDGSIAKTEN